MTAFVKPEDFPKFQFLNGVIYDHRFDISSVSTMMYDQLDLIRELQFQGFLSGKPEIQDDVVKDLITRHMSQKSEDSVEDLVIQNVNGFYCQKETIFATWCVLKNLRAYQRIGELPVGLHIVKAEDIACNECKCWGYVGNPQFSDNQIETPTPTDAQQCNSCRGHAVLKKIYLEESFQLTSTRVLIPDDEKKNLSALNVLKYSSGPLILSRSRKVKDCKVINGYKSVVTQMNNIAVFEILTTYGGEDKRFWIIGDEVTVID